VLPRTCANFGVTVTVTVDGVPSHGPSPGLARVTVTVDGVPGGPGLARRPSTDVSLADDVSDDQMPAEISYRASNYISSNCLSSESAPGHVVELIRVTSQRQFRYGLISNTLEKPILLGAPNFLTYRER
jgi:hypothetical protein